MTFTEQFQQLDSLLVATRDWWQFGAFFSTQSRWQDIAPELDTQLNNSRFGFNDFESRYLEELETSLHNFIPQLKPLNYLTKLPQKYQKITAPDPHWRYQIAGRKWSQISHFAAQVPSQQHLLEWCAGKGHLGRLAATQEALSLTSIEWQEGLCKKNHGLNQRLHLDDNYCPSKVIQADVLNDSLDEDFQSQHFALALHACGDLHTHLVSQVAEKQTAGLCLAPCCYNLTLTPCYQALSQQGQQSQLNLSKLDLSLPLKQIVTAGEREQREQQQEKHWRISFDCWQRAVRETDEYLPLPTIPKSVLKGDFKDFICWAAQKKSLNCSQNLLDDNYLSSILEQAENRLPLIAQMEWVQKHFQRALEIWLILDQVLLLESKGFNCELFEFCDKQYTPRNIMLKATPH